jgi:hypothetical protein
MGIMVSDHSLIRHTTASQERLMADEDVSSIIQRFVTEECLHLARRTVRTNRGRLENGQTPLERRPKKMCGVERLDTS